MPIRTFFIQQCCDRCDGELGEKRTMSSFTGEVLCKHCSADEEERKQKKIIEKEVNRPADRKTQQHKIKGNLAYLPESSLTEGNG